MTWLNIQNLMLVHGKATVKTAVSIIIQMALLLVSLSATCHLFTCLSQQS